MPKTIHSTLTRRERQIMDVLCRIGRGTVTEVMAELSGNPTYSTVRAQLRVLEEKGHLRHEEVGLRFVYMPATPRHAIRKTALSHLLETFFEGSPVKVVAALLGADSSGISHDELERISELIEKAKKQSKRT
jgi:BlaI family transcriptional regulator, penicillinase repressor